MTGHSSWLSRFLALVLLVAVLAGIYLLGIDPLVSQYRANEQAIAEAQLLIGRFDAVAMSEEDLQQSVKVLTERHASEPYYLTKQTDALAAVELQNRAKKAIKANGGTIRSIQSLAAEKEGEFQRVTVRVQMTTTIGPLLRIIHELETTQPFLFLDNVDIKSRQARATTDKQTAEPSLTVTLDLYGYQPPEAL